jgi:uncharacterized membrane protein (UPF0136 family)
MSEDQVAPAVFNAAEIRAFRILGIIVGLEVFGIAYVSKSGAALALAVALGVAVLILAPLTIFLFRRRKLRAK